METQPNVKKIPNEQGPFVFGKSKTGLVLREFLLAYNNKRYWRFVSSRLCHAFGDLKQLDKIKLEPTLSTLESYQRLLEIYLKNWYSMLDYETAWGLPPDITSRMKGIIHSEIKSRRKDALEAWRTLEKIKVASDTIKAREANARRDAKLLNG